VDRGQGPLEQEGESVSEISNEAALGGGATGRPGLGPAAGEAELRSMV